MFYKNKKQETAEIHRLKRRRPRDLPAETSATAVANPSHNVRNSRYCDDELPAPPSPPPQVIVKDEDQTDRIIAETVQQHFNHTSPPTKSSKNETTHASTYRFLAQCTKLISFVSDEHYAIVRWS
ncbi:hypothetical protein AAG570_002483 [Ranatra chinensis]|uniref:Uncharacterized protein n=1 Tax=Ranatra chinensis TaxID=642074 RepID=A0ABD0YQF3_9HEMI